MNDIKWTSPVRRKGVVGLLVSIFQQAVADELIVRNPALSIPGAKVPKREVDPFTKDEADSIIAHLTETTSGMTAIYAAYFEFCFYTGMRPGEVMALRWSEIDRRARTANVCRIQIRGVIQDRTKTKRSRKVLLNDRAMHALEKARPLTEARSDYVFAPSGTGDRSEMFIRSETSQ